MCNINTASTQIQQLKSKASDAESGLSSFKKKYNSILTLCFLLIIVIVAQIGYIMRGEDNAKVQTPIASQVTPDPVKDNSIKNADSTQVNELPKSDTKAEIISDKNMVVPNQEDTKAINVKKDEPVENQPEQETSITEKTLNKVDRLYQPSTDKKNSNDDTTPAKDTVTTTAETTKKTTKDAIKEPAEKIIENTTKEISTTDETKIEVNVPATLTSTNEIKTTTPQQNTEKDTAENIAETPKVEAKEKRKTAIKKHKKEKKAKKKLLKMIWSDYRKAISKANLISAEENLLKIINIDPTNELAHGLLKELSTPLAPTQPKEDSK